MKKMLLFMLSVSLISCSAPANNPSPSASPSASANPNNPNKTLPQPSGTKLVEYNWTEGKLKFNLPENMKEQKNTAEMFEASNDNIYFQLLPWKDAKLTKEDVLNEAIKQADNVDFNSLKVDEEQSGEYELNSFRGYIVVGETKLKDSPNDTYYLGVVAMIDPQSESNFISYITINKQKLSEDQKNLNVAGDIVASFKKL